MTSEREEVDAYIRPSAEVHKNVTYFLNMATG